eukprot:287480_1
MTDFGLSDMSDSDDLHQYTMTDILALQRVYGDGFMGNGGIESAKLFVSKLDLRAREKVLEIGCGPGGGAFYMAKTFGVKVLGVDINQQMISDARKTAKNINFSNDGSVEFLLYDVCKMEIPENTFDLIYSRDCILHVKDKQFLFGQFYKWLKPKGKIFITDYCLGQDPPNNSRMIQYVEKYGYTMNTLLDYKDIIKSAGFTSVVAKDFTVQFMQILRKELEFMTQNHIKNELISKYGHNVYQEMLDVWKSKCNVRCASGDQIWGVLYAEKPSQTYLEIKSKL